MALDQPSEAVVERPRDDGGRFVAQQKHESAEAAVERMFGGGEEAEANQPVAEAPVVEDGQEAAAPVTSQPEEVEVEIEGEKYMMPKKISDRFIQHADYTRKTQDLAEMRRSLSAEREVSALNAAFEKAVGEEKSRLAVLDAQLAQAKHINWGAIEDVSQLVKTREQVNQLREAREALAAEIKAKRSEFDEKIKAHVQEAMQAGEKYIAQHIKGFNEQTKKELFQYGTSEGYTKAELDRIMDPRIVVSLWKAQQWDALQASKPGTLNRAASAAPVVKPGASTKPVSRIQASQKAFQSAKGQAAKKDAALDYFTQRFSMGGK